MIYIAMHASRHHLGWDRKTLTVDDKRVRHNRHVDPLAPRREYLQPRCVLREDGEEPKIAVLANPAASNALASRVPERAEQLDGLRAQQVVHHMARAQSQARADGITEQHPQLRDLVDISEHQASKLGHVGVRELVPAVRGQAGERITVIAVDARLGLGPAVKTLLLVDVPARALAAPGHVTPPGPAALAQVDLIFLLLA